MFFSEYQPTDEILLQPSEVSITAISGSLVGTLTTMTKNPGETFVYELIDEAQLPFRIIGDRLVVAKKDGLDFYVSSAEEALIPIAIISKGNMSAPVRKSFYVRIIGEIMNNIYIFGKQFFVCNQLDFCSSRFSEIQLKRLKMDLSIEIRYSLMDPCFHTLTFFPWNWY